MEENLLKIFELADKLNKIQNNVFAKIEYTVNDTKRLVISIISKDKLMHK